MLTCKTWDLQAILRFEQSTSAVYPPPPGGAGAQPAGRGAVAPRRPRPRAAPRGLDVVPEGSGQSTPVPCGGNSELALRKQERRGTQSGKVARLFSDVRRRTHSSRSA